MKEMHIETILKILQNSSELTGEQTHAAHLAQEAARSAYAPYSRFCVGAALVLENGEIVTGSNQENGAYPSGLCAERVALFYAGARYPGVAVRLLAIAAVKDGVLQDVPVSPCGACRQVMLESEHRGGKPMAILLIGANEMHLIGAARDLLPLPFVLNPASGTQDSCAP